MRSAGPTFVQWSGHIHANYEAARGVNPLEALQQFKLFVKDRIEATRKSFLKPNPGVNFGNNAVMKFAANVVNNIAVGREGTLIPTDLEIRQPEVFGRKTLSASLSYFYILNNGTLADLGNAIAASSLWRPVPGTNWAIWQKSMTANNVNNVRGHAGLRFNPVADDRILDSCDPKKLPAVPGQEKGAPPTKLNFNVQLPGMIGMAVPGGAGGGASQGAGPGGGGLFAGGGTEWGFKPPTPASSWLDYQFDVTVEVTDETVELKSLPA